MRQNNFFIKTQPHMMSSTMMSSKHDVLHQCTNLLPVELFASGTVALSAAVLELSKRSVRKRYFPVSSGPTRLPVGKKKAAGSITSLYMMGSLTSEPMGRL